MLTALLVVACSGSSTTPAAASPAGSGSGSASGSAPAASGPVAALNARAADGSLGRADRCGAIFELFDKHLAPGVTSTAAQVVFTDRTWLAASVDERVQVLGGWIPVELNQNDATFVIRCLATPRADLGGLKWSDWVIYGRIAGTTVTTFTPFLAAPSATLVEFALSYPDGRIEMYKPTGRSSTHL